MRPLCHRQNLQRAHPYYQDRQENEQTAQSTRGPFGGVWQPLGKIVLRLSDGCDDHCFVCWEAVTIIVSNTFSLLSSTVCHVFLISTTRRNRDRPSGRFNVLHSFHSHVTNNQPHPNSRQNSNSNHG